jgi:hypothetical protein
MHASLRAEDLPGYRASARSLVNHLGHSLARRRPSKNLILRLCLDGIMMSFDVTSGFVNILSDMFNDVLIIVTFMFPFCISSLK